MCFISPSSVTESFAGHGSLGWHLWSYRICETSVQTFLTFRDSIEKSGVILIAIPLCYWIFFPSRFSILFLYSMGLVFWLSCAKGNLFSGTVYLMFSMLLVIFKMLPPFSSMVLLKIISIPLTWVSFHSYIPINYIFSLFTMSQNSWVFCACNILDLTSFLIEVFISFYLFFNVSDSLLHIFCILLLRLASMVSVWVPKIFPFLFSLSLIFLFFQFYALNYFFISFHYLCFHIFH